MKRTHAARLRSGPEVRQSAGEAQSLTYNETSTERVADTPRVADTRRVADTLLHLNLLTSVGVYMIHLCRVYMMHSMSNQIVLVIVRIPSMEELEG